MEAINSIFKSIDNLYYECARNSGMSEAAFYIMMAVHTEDAECTQADICEKWAMSRQTVNSALKKLEKDGYLTLVPAESGKKKVIHLTEKGLAYATEHIDPIYANQDLAWASLTPEKQELFLSIFQEYNQVFKDAMEQFIKTKYHSSENSQS